MTNVADPLPPRSARYGRHFGDIVPGPSSGAEVLQPALRGPYLLLEDLLRERCVGAVALDYASGQGVHSITPARFGAKIVQLDLSAGALAVGTLRAQQEGMFHRCRPVQGDCERLPFQDACFDVIISAGAFSYLDVEAARRELARVLKPEGSLIVVDTLGHNPALNRWRRFGWRRGHRTRWEVEHVLRLGDLDAMKNSFRQVEVRYFDLLTLPCALLPAVLQWAVPIARKADAALLNRTPLRRLAFKFVAIFSDPVQ